MSFDLNRPVPILVVGDGCDLPTGLARISRDLCYQLSAMPEFRVAHLGRRTLGRAQYPWMQYSFGAQDQWGEKHIQNVWEDWSRGQFGVILTVWDASRLTWFGYPAGIEGELGTFLRSTDKFEKWGYFMQDGSGVDPNRLPLKDAYTMAGYDRVLLASRWGYGLAKNSLPEHPDLDWLPHGIDRAVFKPVDRLYARSAWSQFGWKQNDKIVGCVMANLERKHWPIVFEAVARLKDVKLWAHTDHLRQYWDLKALVTEYEIGDRVILDEREYSDEEMAMRYSGCDCTVVVSGGEGFCYPCAESLSCGVPVVSGAYGAQRELLNPQMGVVVSRGTQVQTLHNIRRATYDASEIREMIRWNLTEPPDGQEQRVEHLDWPVLGIQWRKWFKRGLLHAAPIK